MDETHLYKSKTEKIIHCSDGIICDNDIIECDVNENSTIISLAGRGERSGWSLPDLSLRLLKAIDWAGERLASAVGLTDSKFDDHLWEREYLDREEAEREANTFILSPTTIYDSYTPPLV